MSDTLYLFFDESGDFNFSPKGSPYFHFGVLSTLNPSPLSAALIGLRYQMLGEGHEIERFHATEDRQAVRDRVFATMSAAGGFEFDSVVVEKSKTHPSLYDHVRFYPKFAGYLLEYVFNRFTDPKQRVVLITDRLPVQKQREAVEKAFKTFIRSRLGERPFTILHQASSVHPCLQAADYCTWAIHKKWRNSEMRPYANIRDFVRSEFDIFQHGKDRFY